MQSRQQLGNETSMLNSVTTTTISVCFIHQLSW